MDRRDFFKLTGKLAIVASLIPEVLADGSLFDSAIPKTSAKYKFIGSYYDFGYQYGLALEIDDGEKYRHAAMIPCDQDSVKEVELRVLYNSLLEWTKERRYAGLPSFSDVKAKVLV